SNALHDVSPIRTPRLRSSLVQSLETPDPHPPLTRVPVVKRSLHAVARTQRANGAPHVGRRMVGGEIDGIEERGEARVVQLDDAVVPKRVKPLVELEDHSDNYRVDDSTFERVERGLNTLPRPGHRGDVCEALPVVV